jgi:hypothetical protein
MSKFVTAVPLTTYFISLAKTGAEANDIAETAIAVNRATFSERSDFLKETVPKGRFESLRQSRPMAQL